MTQILPANKILVVARRPWGCSWVQIANTFAEVGLLVTPDALRFAINATPRNLKKYPRRSIAQKRQGRKTSVSTGKTQASATDEERDEDRSEAMTEISVHAPASLPKAVAITKSSDVPPAVPTTVKPDSDHVIFRRNPNDPI
jgi:hypothetical protein